MDEPIDFKVEKHGPQGYFDPDADLIAALVPSMREVVKNMIDSGVRELKIDMLNVNVIDSTGIGFLVAVYNSLKRLSGELILKNVSKEQNNLFKYLRLDSYFKIEVREET